MAQLKVENYTHTRTAANIKNDDLFDITATDDVGVSYDSAKMTWAEMKIAVQAAVSAVNLYNANGALTGNRQVNLSTNTLTFLNGDTGYGVAPTAKNRVHIKSEATGYGLWIDDNVAALRMSVSDKGLMDLRSVTTNSTIIGQLAGNATMTGEKNTFFGHVAGVSITSGEQNTFFGDGAGAAITTENDNTFLGYNAGGGATGEKNTYMGSFAGNSSTGNNNAILGYSAGSNNTGSNNTLIGYQSGVTGDGSNNVFLGYQAGYYSTESNIFLLDNQQRASSAGEKTDSLLYGYFDSTVADQFLKINGALFVTQMKSGATQVASTAAANEIWKTASHATLPDNVLLIGV